MKYEIIRTYSAEELSRKVNDYLREGWELHGNMSAVYHKGPNTQGFMRDQILFLQPMVLKMTMKERTDERVEPKAGTEAGARSAEAGAEAGEDTEPEVPAQAAEHDSEDDAGGGNECPRCRGTEFNYGPFFYDEEEKGPGQARICRGCKHTDIVYGKDKE